MGMTEPFIVNDFSLIFLDAKNDSASFAEVKSSDLGDAIPPIVSQYVCVDAKLGGDIRNTVWHSGGVAYKHRRNITITNDPLYTPASGASYNYYMLYLYLHQGYDWSKTRYIHLVVKDNNNGSVYVSMLLDTNDFKIDSVKRFVGSAGWTDCARVCIPRFGGEEFVVSVSSVGMDDISTKASSFGYYYGYPTEFVAMTQSKPFPDYIKTELSIDHNQFLHLNTVTNEAMTLYKSILRYFDVQQGDVENINIEYVVSYSGINRTTGIQESKSYKISNYENVFSPITYGIDINEWVDWDDPSSSLFTVYVTTIITCNGKQTKRLSSMNVDFSSIVVNKKVNQPTSIVTTEVVEKTIVNQQVINEPVKTKIVKINQPIYVKMVESNIQYSEMNVSFDHITVPSYMVVDGVGTINSQETADGKIYFDLTMISKPSSNTVYHIHELSSRKVIHTGKITE